jgi:3-oxoacyl-[acyl-carrier-protein] synthase II
MSEPKGRAGNREDNTASVAGWSLHVPGAGVAAAIPELPGLLAEPPDGACPPDLAGQLLGRKGLLNKDPATRLALCAVHQALGLRPGERRGTGPPDTGTAVVASSNLGNLATVTGMVASVRAGQQREISPLSAPGASSNVLASAVAIWFGFGGPNLMVCSGATSGADAIGLGLLLLRARRAARVVVVGAEPGDSVATAVHAARATAPHPLRAGSACVILVPPGTAPLPLLTAARPAAAAFAAMGQPEVVLGPGGPPAIDLADRWGDLYGAMGVAQAAVATAVASGPAPAATSVVCGDEADGWRTLIVRPASAPWLA